MYREVYSSEYCSNMQTEALKLWHELEQESGLQLLQKHGLLFYGDLETGETVQAGTCTSCMPNNSEHLHQLCVALANTQPKSLVRFLPAVMYASMYSAL